MKHRFTEFDSLVFMGNGARSGADCYRLHQMLDKALGNLSALQQGADNSNGELSDEIEGAAHEICAALLGKRITIGEELPYPGKIERHRY